MRRLTKVLAAARADLASVPRRTWLGLLLILAAELAAAVVVLKFWWKP